MPVSPPPAPATSVRLRLALAWGALAWERLTAGLWPALTLLVAGAALALTNVLPSLPGSVHLGVLALFAAAVAGLAWRGLRRFAWPRRDEARTRLEAISPVSHRPLTTVEDSLSTSTTPLQRALWQRHQSLARAALAKLRSPWPKSEVARRDGYGLRAAALLLLAIALVGAGRDAGARLARAIAPAFGDSNVPVSVKVWITPPAYTNRSPIYVENPSQDHEATKLEIPAGSKALVMVSGTRRATTLTLSEPHQVVVNIPLTPVPTADTTAPNEHASRLEVQLAPTDRIEVRQGARVLAHWDVNWIADQPPTIAYTGEPRDGGRGRLRIDYEAADDYALQSVTGKLTRPNTDGAIDITLTMPPFGPKQAKQTSWHDLGGHPWAGMKVQIVLTATDQAGQTASTPPLEVTLPERSFNNPVAQEIARRRKELMTDASRAAVPARDAFARLLEKPSSFNGDRVVFLALATARYRLSYESAQDAMKGLPELLWQTAVRIEDGTLGETEQRLEAAEKALREAMERNAPADEVSRLLDELQRSFADYARALAERMPDRNNMQLGGMDKQGNMVSPEQIAKAMEQLRQLSKMGAQDAAKQMLANLQNMLQTMKNAAAGNGGDSPEMKSAQEMMQQMRELTEKQGQLLNETFDQVRQQALRNSQQKDGEDQNTGKQGADKQEKLRQQLGELMSKMANMAGQTPGSMGDAESAMKSAEQALQAGALRRGAESQGQALSKMEAGMQEASQEMMQALAKKGMSGLMQMPGGQRRLDLLGPRNGLDDGENVHVPNGPDTEGMAQRVRSILEEIRKRAADRTRPEAEQEYLRRLMKEF